MSNSEKQFQLWLDGKLDAEQAVQFEQSIEDNAELKQRLAMARYLEQQVHCIAQEDVPAWDRESTFSTDKSPWWQWQGLPVLSFTSSVFAIMLVIFNVQFISTEQGYAVNFGHQEQQTAKDVNTLIEQQLGDFAKEQQVVMTNFVSDLKQSQTDNNLKLASYLMSTTRQERQQDISAVVKFVNEQRDDDLLDQKLRLQKLEYNLQTQSFNTMTSPVTLQNTNYPIDNSKE
ncbi:anti-sigma factor family protein [Thalassotalea crassostreae]|uniref:anti-sigma factor family protein n=1 Tax=Thalassotalea crassostreae TaxID=1763536 RepID=UPI0008395B01|nr:hypothetical protein [Thalassotalea crassostreae]